MLTIAVASASTTTNPSTVSSFYAVVAQVIPVLAVAVVLQTRFLPNLSRPGFRLLALLSFAGGELTALRALTQGPPPWRALDGVIWIALIVGFYALCEPHARLALAEMRQRRQGERVEECRRVELAEEQPDQAKEILGPVRGWAFIQSRRCRLRAALLRAGIIIALIYAVWAALDVLSLALRLH